MKRGPQQRGDKSLSIKGLLKTVQGVFKGIKPIKETIRGRPTEISLVDCLMSALAMFGLKSPSLLAFDQARREDVLSQNLEKLYGVTRTPSDTHMREVLDEVNPKAIRGAFNKLFSQVQRGKLLERFSFLGGNYLVSIDGTGVFESEKVNCENCCTKKFQDGSIRYNHMILGGVLIHPDSPQVLPFCPEPITKQDGDEKNDCELNSAYRFLQNLKHDHPRLKMTLTCDALFGNAPFINTLKEWSFGYIIGVKRSSHKSLFEWMDGIELCEKEFVIGANTYSFRYINQIPLNDTKDAPLVNFFECKAIEIKGKQKQEKNFSWVTSYKISGKNIVELMRGGRAKWKIENETFNTLKNQGYQFEHNFGHGEKNLHTVFAFLMMLAFSIDQIGEAADGLFQAAFQKLGSRRRLWERMRGFFHLIFINSWEDMFNAIAFGYRDLILAPNTS